MKRSMLSWLSLWLALFAGTLLLSLSTPSEAVPMPTDQAAALPVALHRRTLMPHRKPFHNSIDRSTNWANRQIGRVQYVGNRGIREVQHIGNWGIGLVGEGFNGVGSMAKRSTNFVGRRLHEGANLIRYVYEQIKEGANSVRHNVKKGYRHVRGRRW